MIKLILLLYETVVQFSFFFLRIHPIIEILGILCFLTILLIHRSFYCYLLLYKPLFSVLTQDGKQFLFYFGRMYWFILNSQLFHL